MRPNRSIPPCTVIPVLVYPDVRQAVAWLTAAFGFAERTRIGESHRAQMSIGEDGAMIVADVRGEQQPPQQGIVTHVMKVRVDNVEAWYQRARAHGARVPGRPPLAVHRDGQRRGARGLRLPDRRALALEMTVSPPRDRPVQGPENHPGPL